MVPFAPRRLATAAFVVVSLPFASCFAGPTLCIVTKSSALSAHSNGRREFIQTFASVGTVVIVPSIANASQGASSNIVMPNYIEYLIEKNQQTNQADMLYKGPDVETQLRRIGEAGQRLPEIATLAEEKKWSQVQGIISGPLGTLLQTMNSVASIAGTKEAKDAAKAVKTDLFEIGAAAGRKESAPCTKAAAKAEKDLEKFVRVAFK